MLGLNKKIFVFFFEGPKTVFLAAERNVIDCTPSVGRAASDLKRSGYAIRKRSIDLIICLIEFRGNALR